LPFRLGLALVTPGVIRTAMRGWLECSLIAGVNTVTIRQVLKMGNPLLAEPCSPVDIFNSEELQTLVQDLHDTMVAEDGAGIAAPQIGVLRRVVMFEVNANPRYPNAEPVPLTVICNPVIKPLSDKTVAGWEGCLSVPGMRGVVSRFEQINYRGYTPEGELIDRDVSGFHARVVQHECDHLDGILYVQRIRDMRQFGFLDELGDILGC